jgi:hypothetical protein
MKFKLEIELGKDDMREQTDIAVALKKISNDLMDERLFGAMVRSEKVSIFDKNGNKVGHWRIG